MKQVYTAYNASDGPDVGGFKYCPMCRHRLTLMERGGRQRPTCETCGYVHFSNPMPGVVVLIEKDEKVLLGVRSGGFGEGKWGLPQGYIEFDEDFLTAAIREVKEETGLDVEIKSIINVVTNQLIPSLHTLAIVLLANILGGEIRAGDDLKTLEWFPLAGPLPEMAFEADTDIIERYHMLKHELGLPVDPRFSG